MTEHRTESRAAFEHAVDLTFRIRRPRRSSIRNDKFACLVVCPCGTPTLLEGEVEFPIFGGLCEGCAQPLPHVTVVTRQHAAELAHLAPTLVGQSRLQRTSAQAKTTAAKSRRASGALRRLAR
jgi:hypothetical protein